MRDHHHHLIHYTCPVQTGRVSFDFTLFGRILTCFLLLLISTFIIIILVDYYIWSVGSDMSLITTFISSWNFMPVVIFEITVRLSYSGLPTLYYFERISNEIPFVNSPPLSTFTLSFEL